MSVIHNRHPIDQTFKAWIANYPESFHPLDMERFYRFVKTVCVYSRRPKGSEWLRERIEQSGRHLDDDVVDTYCDRFVLLQEFYKVGHMRVYQLSPE